MLTTLLIFILSFFALNAQKMLSIHDSCNELRAVVENEDQAQAHNADEFMWLEEINSSTSLEWIEKQNKKTQAVLQSSPRYKTYYEQLLNIFSAPDKIVYPVFRANQVYNFWQDGEHEQGIWRRTSSNSYLSGSPEWDTLLDLDALSQAENKKWTWAGVQGLPNAQSTFLVYLSDGGSDAIEIREFDSDKKQFINASLQGFFFSCQKQEVRWVDSNTLLVGRDWKEGTQTSELTHAGYPYVLKLLKRGQPPAEALELFRGSKTDMRVLPHILRNRDGEVDALLAIQALSFYDAHYYLLSNKHAPSKLNLPEKMLIEDYVNGQLIFTIQQDWKTFKTGDLLACTLENLKNQPHLINAHLVMRPEKNQAIHQITATRDYLIVKGIENVKSFITIYSFKNGQWVSSRLSLAENSTINLYSASKDDNTFCISIENFLMPTQLLRVDAENNTITTLQKLPDRFDSSQYTVEQYWARSLDGTLIPYFIVFPRTIQLDGSAPTVLYGYGGFQISMLPAYLPEMGTCWLEQGGVYVVANIRGGGEFGPNWHQAALKEKRQVAFDDFVAVAQDLIDRKITSPQKLGVYGRSNGGVLTTVFMTQHPELCNAAVIEAPLIDMLRYTQLFAGASWVGEYGDPDNPEERAFIRKYSAYHNIKHNVTYPEVYITASNKDDRVHPAHARKFAAKLQAMGHSFFYYENLIGGHSSGINPISIAERWARHYSYLAYKLID